MLSQYQTPTAATPAPTDPKGGPGKPGDGKPGDGKPGAGKPADPNSPEALKERDRAFRQRQAAREEQEAKEAKERARKEEECKKAALTLNDQRRTPVLYDLTEKGERVYKTDKQREEHIAELQKEYDQRCK